MSAFLAAGAVRTPLEVVSGFAAARDALLLATKDRQRSAEEDADLRFLEGMAAFEHAAAAAGDAEDTYPDPAVLRQALERLEAAAGAFREQRRPIDEACAHFRMARVIERLRWRLETVQAMAEHYRQGLDLLDTVEQPELAFAACLSLAAILRELALKLAGAPRDAELGRALVILQAAELIADGLDDPARRARAKRAAAMALAERFHPDRDQNLLDAIALAGDALPFFQANRTSAQAEYGSLLHQVGTAWLKTEWNRRVSLERARAAFSEGASAIDARRFPRLHDALARHLTMTEGLIADANHSLPDDEMVRRFNARIEAFIDARRLSQAVDAAWAFLQWAWSLPSPNVHVGAAHKMLGTLYFRRGDQASAELHLYCGLAILSAVLAPGDPWFPMVDQAKRDFVKLFEAAGRPDAAAAATAQAERALALSTNLIRRGAAQIQTDASSALDDFENALRLFPASPDALFYRGAVRMNVGVLAPALADFDASLRVRPRNIPALSNRFIVRMKLGDREGALADCTVILDIDPAHEVALFNRAQLKAEKDDWGGAIEDYDRFLELSPGSSAVLTMRAAAREHKGDTAGAADDLERALAGVESEEGRRAIANEIARLRSAPS